MNLPDVERVKRFLTKNTAITGLEKLLNWIEAQEEAIKEAAEDPSSNFALFRVNFGTVRDNEIKDIELQEVFGIAVTEHWFIWQDGKHRWAVSHRLTGFKAIAVKERDIAETICNRLQYLPDIDWNQDSVDDLTNQPGYDAAGKLIMAIMRGQPVNDIVLDLPELGDGFKNGENSKVHIRTLRMKKKRKGALEPHVEADNDM